MCFIQNLTLWEKLTTPLRLFPSLTECSAKSIPKLRIWGLIFTALLSGQLTINIWNIPVIKTLQFMRLGLCWGYRRNMPRNLCEQRIFMKTVTISLTKRQQKSFSCQNSLQRSRLLSLIHIINARLIISASMVLVLKLSERQISTGLTGDLLFISFLKR